MSEAVVRQQLDGMGGGRFEVSFLEPPDMPPEAPRFWTVRQILSALAWLRSLAAYGYRVLVRPIAAMEPPGEGVRARPPRIRRARYPRPHAPRPPAGPK